MRIVLLVAMLLASLLNTGCAFKTVGPGHVGILVDNYGTNKGVQSTPAKTGAVWYNVITEEVIIYPTFMQNAVWTKTSTEGSKNDDSITFNSSEGASINADIGFSYHLNSDMVPTLFQAFRTDLDTITHGYLRSQVRDAFSREASTMKVADIFGSAKQRLLSAVHDDLAKELEPKGIEVDLVTFVSALRVDDPVKDSINLVIQQGNAAAQALAKVQQTKAEAEQLEAQAEGEAQARLTRAKAEAQANEALTASLTPQLLQARQIEKWDGKLPVYTGASGGAQILSLPPLSPPK